MTIDELKEKCSGCQRCPLWQTRTNLVFGVGDEKADVMFVGEAPGENEDKTGIPFVGRAGQLFDKYLAAVGMSRDEIYICNILKCRPPKNRDPQKDEEDACIDYLREQTRIVAPKMIVCLGRIAAMRIIDPNFRITRDHGVFYERKGITLCAVYHPSLLLRDPHKKDDMMYDMLKIKQRTDSFKNG